MTNADVITNAGQCDIEKRANLVAPLVGKAGSLLLQCLLPLLQAMRTYLYVPTPQHARLVNVVTTRWLLFPTNTVSLASPRLQHPLDF